MRNNYEKAYNVDAKDGDFASTKMYNKNEEELEVKPSTLKKAIRIAHKASLGQTNKDHDELNTILETVGKIL